MAWLLYLLLAFDLWLAGPALAQQPQTSSAPIHAVNAKYVQGVGTGYWPTSGTGLTLDLEPGTAYCGDPPAAVNYAGGTLTLADAATNYVFLDPAAGCAPGSNTTGLSAGLIPLASVETAGGVISAITDLRTWFHPLPCTMGSAGNVNCAALGTNQSINLTPSGTGIVKTPAGGLQLSDGTVANYAADDFTILGNYDYETDRLSDTSKPSWGTSWGFSNDQLAIFRAGPATGVPAYARLAYMESGGNLVLGNNPTAGTKQASQTGTVTPRSLSSYVGATGVALTNQYINNPDVYISRWDSTTAAGCQVGVWDNCAAPVARMDMLNDSGTSMSTQVGLGINAWDYHANTQATDGNTVLGIVSSTFDRAAWPNIVELRAGNFIAGVRSVPTQFRKGTTTRAAFGIEVDTQNLTGTNAVFGGTVGNYTGGISIVSNGPSTAHNTLGLVIDSTDPGVGWLTGLQVGAAVNTGVHVTTVAGLNPQSAVHLTTSGSYGLVVGSGTVSTPASFNVTEGNPGVGILLDASGTNGAAQAKDSNKLVFRSTDAVPASYDWTFRQTSNHLFHISSGGTDRVLLDPAGKLGVGATAPTYNIHAQGAGDQTIAATGGSVTAAIKAASGGAVQLGSLTNHRVDLLVNSVAIGAFTSTGLSLGKITAAGQKLDVNGSLMSAVNTVTYSATPNFDASLGNTQKITLTGNVTSSTLSNAAAGEPLHFLICQDATGSRTFAWPSNVKGGMTIGGTASTCSAQTFIFDGTNAYALSQGKSGM